jgi:hypothetical protein
MIMWKKRSAGRATALELDDGTGRDGQKGICTCVLLARKYIYQDS